MSTAGPLLQQLQQDLLNELTTSNQLLRLIGHELEQIKTLTCPRGELESNIKQNTSLSETLANIQQIDIENLPPVPRAHFNSQNMTYQQLGINSNMDNMDDSQ